MSLVALGISHHTAPIAIRERLAFAAGTLPDALGSLAGVDGIHGCSILSTCNRTELYLSAEQPITQPVESWLHQWHDLPPEQFGESLYRLPGEEATAHLIRVVSGMDSMIVGEPQIAGQVRQAWQAAHAAGTLDSPLDRLFQHAFAAAKRVRTETGIGRNVLALPNAAVRLAHQIFDRIEGLSVLLIGAGEMIFDCARQFRSAGLASFDIANRNPERAGELAERFGGRAHGLDNLDERLAAADIVVACTASPQALIDRDMFRAAIARRRHRPVFALDLSVPRNIDPECGRLDDVFLYTIDDLHAIVESGQQKRLAALDQAGEIVAAETGAFERWLRLQQANAMLRTLRERTRREHEHVLERARDELAKGHDPEAVMRRFGHRLVNRLLHVPRTRLRQAAEEADRDLLDAARYYFLDDSE